MKPEPDTRYTKNTTADCKPICTIIKTDKIKNIDHIERKKKRLVKKNC